MTQNEQKNFLWIVVGDIHDEPERFAAIPEAHEADGVIISGDLTVTGSVKQAEAVLNAIQAHCPVLWAQIGNMDRPEVDTWLTEKNINLHRQTVLLSPQIALFGVGASTFTPFGTPSEYPESSFAGWLEDCWRRARTAQHSVLISHNPPKDTACDVIPGEVHVGSSAVREFIEEHQPDICICGHIHEARNLDHLGRTIIVNPGNLAAGGYALLRFANGTLSVEFKVLEETYS